MAGKSVGNKLLSFLSNLFKAISSPISGFDVSDVRVKQDGDNFSSLFQFQTSEVTDNNNQAITDINNNKIEVNVLLKTVNAQTVLNNIFTAINNINNDGNTDADEEQLLSFLFGSSSERGNSELTYYEEDNKKSGHGILGYKFKDFKPDTLDPIWLEYAKEFTYALECTSPGKDYGAISGISYDEIGGCIAEYLETMGVVVHKGEVGDINILSLVVPILSAIQKFIGEYWNAAVEKYVEPENSDDGVPDTSTENAADNIPMEDQSNQTTNNSDGGIGVVTDSSKHIDVILQKIIGTTDVKMTAIKANYGYSDVLDDIDEIINQDEFIQALPEEPTTYAISVDDDGFDIEPCEESLVFNPCESLCEVFKSGIRAYRNLYIIHWMSYGNDMMKLHLLAEDMYEELIKEIDIIGELLVEKQGTVPQLDFPCDYLPIQDYDFQTGLDQIQSLINIYIDCIDYAYCNQDSDVQSILDEWLRYWKKQTRYFIERQEI